MNSRIILGLALSLSAAGCTYLVAPGSQTAAVPFASDGQVKMFYDIRMHPSAIQHDGQISIAWRGARGLPQAISYDLESREFSEQINVFEGVDAEFNFPVYARDQHTTPSIWRDEAGYLNILAGCYGLKSFEITACDKVKTKRPGDVTSGWELWKADIAPSINYANVTEAYDTQTLIYHRDGGHLGSWTYELSPDGRTGWAGPDHPVVDMNAGSSPHVSCLDFYSGSYQNTKISPDGRTLHVAFVWQQEVGSLDVFPAELGDNDCVPPDNALYPEYNLKQGETRYNLYYVKVDLPSGAITNYLDQQLAAPVTRSVADQNAKLIDTGGRLFSAPPAIHLNQEGEPHFLGVISGSTPHHGWFTHVHLVGGEWQETRIARTSNVWNSGLIDTDRDGNLRALLMAGDGEVAAGSPKGTNLNGFGWGDRVEEWISSDNGVTWRLNRDITPEKGMRYQNLRTVSTGMGTESNEVFLFYGWEPDAGPGEAVAFLWDDRL